MPFLINSLSVSQFVPKWLCLHCQKWTLFPTLQFVAGAQETTGLFQVTHGALTSTPLCLLSWKWHTRLAKPSWLYLRALAFSHALISDWLKWQAVTTKVGIKLTDSRYPGYLLMLDGKINSALNLVLWMSSELLCNGLKKEKADICLLFFGY